jgi:hypothetical protein
MVVALGSAAAVAVVSTLPYLAPYWRARDAVGERSRAETLLYSAGPSHYLAATPDNVLYGRTTGNAGREEKRLFPGIVAAALAAFSLWPPVGRRRVAYGAACLVALDLSLGPNGVFYETLRGYVPVYRGLRAPARAGALVLLMVAVLAGFGWARLERALRGRLRGRTAAWPAAVLVLMAAEYAVAPRALVRAPVRPPEVYAWLARQPAGAVLELPVPRGHELPLHDAEFAYYSTFHWRPIVNGYSGNVPASYIDTVTALHPFPTGAAMRRLRAAGVRYIVVHPHLFEEDAVEQLAAAMDASADLRQLRRFEAPAAAVVYEVRPPAE